MHRAGNRHTEKAFDASNAGAGLLIIGGRKRWFQLPKQVFMFTDCRLGFRNFFPVDPLSARPLPGFPVVQLRIPLIIKFRIKRNLLDPLGMHIENKGLRRPARRLRRIGQKGISDLAVPLRAIGLRKLQELLFALSMKIFQGFCQRGPQDSSMDFCLLLFRFRHALTFFALHGTINIVVYVFISGRRSPKKRE